MAASIPHSDRESEFPNAERAGWTSANAEYYELDAELTR
jgi:hypothetical protein